MFLLASAPAAGSVSVSRGAVMGRRRNVNASAGAVALVLGSLLLSGCGGSAAEQPAATAAPAASTTPTPQSFPFDMTTEATWRFKGQAADGCAAVRAAVPATTVASATYERGADLTTAPIGEPTVDGADCIFRVSLTYPVTGAGEYGLELNGGGVGREISTVAEALEKLPEREVPLVLTNDGWSIGTS